jgi:hypothetical protein
MIFDQTLSIGFARHFMVNGFFLVVKPRSRVRALRRYSEDDFQPEIVAQFTLLS